MGAMFPIRPILPSCIVCSTIECYNAKKSLLERQEMVALLDSENRIPPRFTLPAKFTFAVDLSTKLIRPRFTLPFDLAGRRRGIRAYTRTAGELGSEHIALPRLRRWDAIVLWTQLSGIALFTLSAWVGVFLIHVLFTYTIFVCVVTTIIASILASLVYRRAYMRRVRQDARLCTQRIPALHKDTWSHLRAVTADTLSYLAAVGRDRR